MTIYYIIKPNICNLFTNGVQFNYTYFLYSTLLFDKTKNVNETFLIILIIIGYGVVVPM